ncbi:Thiazole synthase [Clarias magur]|uniref:Thiazole synthase n=1 Tax=Clarias magur TaxID=1594786 RepID=A0A8J4UJG0_CLAMG|nr:Thiazole synthase [Clarias magur]
MYESPEAGVTPPTGDLEDLAAAEVGARPKDPACIDPTVMYQGDFGGKLVLGTATYEEHCGLKPSTSLQVPSHHSQQLKPATEACHCFVQGCFDHPMMRKQPNGVWFFTESLSQDGERITKCLEELLHS